MARCRYLGFGSLRAIVDEGATRSKDWPSSPEALSNRLRRAATFLRKAGVEVSFYREGKQGARMISIQHRGGLPSEPSELSDEPSAANDSNGLEADSLADGLDDSEGTVSHNPLKYKGADTADMADGCPARSPGGGKTRI